MMHWFGARPGVANQPSRVSPRICPAKVSGSDNETVGLLGGFEPLTGVAQDHQTEQRHAGDERKEMQRDQMQRCEKAQHDPETAEDLRAGLVTLDLGETRGMVDRQTRLRPLEDIDRVLGTQRGKRAVFDTDRMFECPARIRRKQSPGNFSQAGLLQISCDTIGLGGRRTRIVAQRLVNIVVQNLCADHEYDMTGEIACEQKDDDWFGIPEQAAGLGNP